MFGLILVASGLGVTGALPRHAAVASRCRGLWLCAGWSRGSSAAERGARAARRCAARPGRRRLAGGHRPVPGRLLQNVDVIMVKRQIGGDAAGAYAAAAVAAKAVVWVAIGIGLYLLPEATRARPPRRRTRGRC